MSVHDEPGIAFPDPVTRSEHEATVARLTPVGPPAPRREAPPSGEVSGVGPPLLRLVRGPQTGAAFALPPGTTGVGRDRGSDIVLDDPTVSRHHAEFRRIGNEVTVADSGSLNGTYVNRMPSDERVLADGDEVWVGKFRLLFRDRH